MEEEELHTMHESTINSPNTNYVQPSHPDSDYEVIQNDVYDDKLWCVLFGDGNDKENPMNMSPVRKWIIVILISLLSVNVTCISSAWSLASDNIIEHFGISHEVSVLGISLYIWGLGTGGIFLSPISEFHGRRIVYVVGLALMIAFQFLTAFCDNIGGMLFGRLASGIFGASFMSVASGTFSDLFDKEHMHYPIMLYGVSPFLGPLLGPLISGFVNSHISFRWTFYIMIIWSGALLGLLIVIVPETYQPVLLHWKAQRLRKETGDNRYYAPIERDKESLFESIILSSKRPILLLVKDPMMLVLCFYSGFCLAIVYMFFVAIPYIFKTVYDFNLSQQGMSFLGLMVGMLIACIGTPTYVQKKHEELVRKNNGVAKPEFRFLALLVGVFFVPIGLFILAWTTYRKVHWIAPIIGSAVFGFATVLVFNGIFAYTVEAYRLYTASAMAANSFVRSLMSGVFPLFGLQMYEHMGIHWASTLLALFGCLLIPVPFLFYRFGEKLRSLSPYAWS